MAFSMKTAFASISATCFLLFLLQGDSLTSDSHVEAPPESSPRSHISSGCRSLTLTKIFNAINWHKTPLFVADPDFLITSKNQFDECHERTSDISGETIINLGLLGTYVDQDDIEDQICQPLVQNDFECVRIEKGKIALLNKTVVTHIVIASSKVKVHVVCFIPVLSNVLWVQAMEQAEAGFLYGVNQSEVYDSFQIRRTLRESGDVLPMPMDTQAFVRQIPTSRFTSCDRESARNVTGREGDEEQELGAVQINTYRSMIQMKRLMSQVGVTFFLISGTLLGWYRECRAIPYTTDADFATWASNARPDVEAKILNISHRNSAFKVYNIFGKLDMGYEMSFLLPNGFKTDLFFLYEESENRLSTSGHVVSQRLYYKYFYPAIRLCSTIFLGVRVNVPCDTESILGAEYGEWRTRVNDSVYDYKSSPSNRGPAIKYPKRMFPLYRQFP